MKLESRIRWLRTASLVTIGFGLLIAVAAIPALQAPVAFLLDLIFFPLDDAPAAVGSPERLLSAIAGGVMAGWGVMSYLVATELLPREPALARRFVLAGIFTWFAVDSSMSVAAGAPLNVIGNLGFLLLFVVPVWTLSGPGPEVAVDRG